MYVEYIELRINSTKSISWSPREEVADDATKADRNNYGTPHGAQGFDLEHDYLNGYSVAALGGDDAVVSIVVDLVVVDGQEVAVVVGVEAVHRVVVHLVPPPVSLLVAVGVDPEMVVVDVRAVSYTHLTLPTIYSV